MKRIRCDDDIELPALPALGGTRLLCVEHRVLHERQMAEKILRVVQEVRTDISDDVFDTRAIEQRNDVRRRSARSSPQLQHTNGAIRWYSGDQRFNCMRNERIQRAECR